MPESSSPKWPRYGCKFCPAMYVSRPLLNRHLDLYLHEYTEAFEIKSVKSTLLRCHPLPVLRAIRSKSERHPGIERDESRIIQWDDLTFTPYDKDLDLAVKLFNSEAVDVFKRRALMSATQWIDQLGYVHSPKKVLPTNTTDDEDLDQDASDPDGDQDASLVKGQGPNQFGVLSRRLFSNVGANKQLAVSTGNHKRSSNDSVSINCVSNDIYDLVTPPRRTSEQTIEPRKRKDKKTPSPTLFKDSDSEPDDEYGSDLNTPTVKGRKGKGKEAPRFMDSVVVRTKSAPPQEPIHKKHHDHGESNRASVHNIEKEIDEDEPIPISPDASDQGTDEGMCAANGDLTNAANDDDAIIDLTDSPVKPKDLSRLLSSPTPSGPSKRSRTLSDPKDPPKLNLIPSYIGRRLAEPYATPRTRSAQFFTPGNDVPVVLWLNVILYPGCPKICVPVRLGCSHKTAIQQVRQKLREGGVDEGWPELVGLELMENPGDGLSDSRWAELVANGGIQDVGLVWQV